MSVATAPEVAIATPGAGVSVPRPRSRRSPIRHPAVMCLLLLLAYVGLSLVNDPRAFLGTDTGGKVATLRAMDLRGDSHPDVGYWAARPDPDGLVHPLHYTQHVGDRWVNVTTLPMIYAARPLYDLGGLRGILLLPMAGGVVVALGAAALARRLGGGDGAVAFWLVGLATPVAVYALDFWEHTLGLGCMLWGVVLLHDLADGRAGWRAALGAGALFGAAATMRTEALVYGLVTLGLAVLAAWRRRGRLPWPDGVAGLCGLGVPLALNRVLEQAALGSGFRAGRVGGAAGGGGQEASRRLEEALRTTVGLNHFAPAADWVVGACIVAFVGAAVVSFRTRDGRHTRLGALALGAAAVLYAVRFADGPGFVSGMLTASPLAIVGLLAAGRRRVLRFPVAVAALALPVVWAFQYSGGAGPQWGGRYVLLSGVLLAVVGVVSLPDLARPGAVALVVLALAVTGCGLAWLSVRSHSVADALAEIDRIPGPVVVADAPHLLREGGAFYDPGQPWLTVERPAELPVALRVVDRSGSDRFTLVTLGRTRARPVLGGFRRGGSRPLDLVSGIVLRLTTYHRA